MEQAVIEIVCVQRSRLQSSQGKNKRLKSIKCLTLFSVNFSIVKNNAMSVADLKIPHSIDILVSTDARFLSEYRPPGYDVLKVERP